MTWLYGVAESLPQLYWGVGATGSSRSKIGSNRGSTLVVHWDFIAHLEQQQQIYKNQVYTTSTISQKSLKTNKKTKKSSWNKL